MCDMMLVSCADPEPVIAPAPLEVLAVKPVVKVAAPQELVKKVTVQELKKGEITSVELPRVFEM